MTVPTKFSLSFLLLSLVAACTNEHNKVIEDTTNSSDTMSIEGTWRQTEISFAGSPPLILPESGSITYYTDDTLYTFHYPYYSNPSYAYHRNGSELIYILENGQEKKWKLKMSGNEFQLTDKSSFGDNIHKYQRVETDEAILKKLMAIEVDWSHFNSIWNLDTNASNYLYQNSKIDSKSPVPFRLDLQVSNSSNFTTNKRALTYSDSVNTYNLWFLAYRPGKLNLRLFEDALETLSDTLVFVKK